MVHGWLATALLVLTVGCGSLPRIIILNDPLTPEEHVQLGLSYEAQGNWALAEREYRAALDQDPHVLSALAGLGNVYAQQGQYPAAEPYYRRALRENPNHPMVNNNLAAIYITQNTRLEDAARMIERALSADPAHRAFYLDTRAQLYLRLGQIDQARGDAAEAERAPGSEDPAFWEQHAITKSQIDTVGAGLKPAPTSDRTETP